MTSTIGAQLIWRRQHVFTYTYRFQVNVVEEEKDDLKMSSDALGKIIANPQQPRQKVVNIKKDDLEMIMHELELSKSVVEKKLIEVNGDPIAAIKNLIGFDT
ncbi:hypothetical protein DICVIV_07558 [Dictyocaulus viviparus]|uniref:Nascent polypeptide-associated complex subunit alpha-like UBA domain-containing protein n=1 Tax=Dictyocaulus viviparus TaxID=29172 RepID=A0A0D8XPD3_DICVI|nr:hypothetical protein DICVIV_07558 [Dictyocaulus viviparus]